MHCGLPAGAGNRQLACWFWLQLLFLQEFLLLSLLVLCCRHSRSFFQSRIACVSDRIFRWGNYPFALGNGDSGFNSDTNLFVFVQFVTLRCIKSLFIAGFRIGMSVET